MTAAQRLYVSMGFDSAGERITPDGTRLLEYSLNVDAAPRATR